MAPKVTDEYKEQKKNEILEAAKMVFIRKGFDAVTMKDIIDESGLSRGGVYLYYSSTEEIFQSLLELSDNIYIEAIRKLADDGSGMWDKLVMLIGIVKGQLTAAGEGLAPAIYEYFLSVKRNNQLRPLLVKRFDQALSNLELLIKKGIDRGEFHPKASLDQIAKFLIMFMDGISINIIHLGAETVELDGQVNQVLSYLKYILQAGYAD